MPSITEISFEIGYLKFYSDLPGANELTPGVYRFQEMHVFGFHPVDIIPVICYHYATTLRHHLAH